MLGKLNPARHQTLPTLRLPWKLLWFLALLLITSTTYRENLKRIAGNTLFLLSERTQNQHNLADALWWSELSYRLGVGRAENFDQAALLVTALGRMEEQSLWQARAMNSNSPNAAAINNFAVTSFLHKHNTDIQPMLTSAFILAPNSALLRYNLGMAQMQQKRFAEAQQMLKETTYIDDKWMLPHLQLSVLAMKTGDFALAEKEARTALLLEPRQINTHLALINSLFEQEGRVEDRLQATENALVYFPNQPILQLYKALCLRDKGEQQAALKILQGLYPISLDPAIHARIAKEIHFLLLRDN